MISVHCRCHNATEEKLTSVLLSVALPDDVVGCSVPAYKQQESNLGPGVA